MTGTGEGWGPEQAGRPEPAEVRVEAHAGGHARQYIAGRDLYVQVGHGQAGELSAAADDLATAVLAEWEREAGLRLLNDPGPLSVRWQAAEPGLVGDWYSLAELARAGAGWPVPPAEGSWAEGPGELAGSGNQLAEVIGRVPTGRLVVLGEPGAGKTILLVRLVLDLLRRRVRGSGAPVPVLISLASWDPAADDLYGWLERRLAIDYINLGRRAPGGAGRPRRTLGRALLDERLVLLVLDGLDEIPAAVRGHAITRINDVLGPGQGLVLASRLGPFTEAVRPPGGIETELAGAAAVVLCRLDAGVAAEYLRRSAGGPASAARWDHLLSGLAADPTLPAAQALATPLMVGLARAVYTPRPGEPVIGVRADPGELLDRGHFPTRASVEEHLLDAFVRAAYRREPGQGRREERWLVFFARCLEERHQPTTSFAWWELSAAAPRQLAGLTVGVVAALAGALGLVIPAATGAGLSAAVLTGLAVRRLSGHGAGAALTLASGLAGGLAGTALGLALFTRLEGVGPALTGALAAGIAVTALRSIQAGLAGGFAGGLAAVFASTPQVSLSGQLINGLGLGLAGGCAAGLTAHSRPARGFRWSPLGFLAGAGAGATMGLAADLQGGLFRGLLVGAVAGLVGSFAMGFETAPADPQTVPSPRNALLRDRRTFWATGVLGGLAVGLSTALGPPYPPGARDWALFAFRVGAANTLAVGLALGFFRAAYGKFVLARWWLAARRRLPWRLMAFLADAHEHRGVLRQAGSVYEFRHADLQHRLARRP